MSKVWFITGTSKGFGRIWAEAALERGDRVAATARDTGTPRPTLVESYGDSVLPIALDVTDKAAVDAAVERRTTASAGSTSSSTTPATGCSATIEEVTEEQARAQLETNLFGALWVTKAALPYPARAGLGPHHPGVLDRRRERVPDPRPLPRLEVGARGLHARPSPRRSRGFGIKVTLVEPTGYSTDWAGPPSVQADAAARLRRGARGAGRAMHGARPNGASRRRPAPRSSKVVDAEEPPLRIFFGDGHARDDPRRVRAAARGLGAVGRRRPGGCTETLQ